MQKRFSLSLALVVAVLQTPVLAADDHKGHDHDAKTGAHAHEAKPAHGGVVSVAKDMNFELVTQPDRIALYVSDHGKPVDLAGATAKVTMLSGSEKSEVTLAPASDRLEAVGRYKVGPGTKAVAQVKLAKAAPVSVRFTLK